MKHKVLSIAILLAALVAVKPGQLSALAIDFSAFDIIDPSVAILGLGEVKMLEDQSLAPVTLLDYNLPIPLDALILSFDFELTVPEDNEDYFDFYFGDLSQYSDSFGGPEGVYSGTITKDLSGFRGSGLPLAFSFMPNDNEYDSILTISNAKINPVPEPSSVILVCTGILAMVAIRRRYR